MRVRVRVCVCVRVRVCVCVCVCDSWYAGSLPQESVCTENLTPWLHMLPCGGRAGLAALLGNRSTVFSSGKRIHTHTHTHTHTHRHTLSHI